MKISALAVVLVIFPLAAASQARVSVTDAAPVTHPAAAADFANVPLSFEMNQGQSNSQVRFLSRGQGYSLFLTDSAAVLALSRNVPAARKAGHSAKVAVSPARQETDVVRMELPGANHDLRVAGDDELPGKANYFIGRDRAKWHSDVPTYAKVKYADVYPGVDLVYYGNQGQLEYDFVVAPDADPQAVRMRFAGAERLTLTADGDLKVAAKNGSVVFQKPVLYQMENGQRRRVDGGFQLLAKNDLRFWVGAYDHRLPLVIDPTLMYSTYLGGNANVTLYGSTAASKGYGGGYGNIAVDSAGDTYIIGTTPSSDFPVTSNAYQKVNHSVPGPGAVTSNVFVAKLYRGGHSFVYSTYLGGSDEDIGIAIAIDAKGYAYVTGATTSLDFPLSSNAFQQLDYAGAMDPALPAGFVSKLNPTGSELLYSTYLGGSGAGAGEHQVGDFATAIAVDSSGDAYVAGSASSDNFPVTAGSFQQQNNVTPIGDTYAGNPNAFLTKLNADASALIYSTYLGGSIEEFASAVAVNSAGNAYVTGFSYSPDFPTTSGAYQTVNNGAAKSGSNAFLTEFNPAGSALVYSTLLGGSGNAGGTAIVSDGSNAMALDAAGNAYITGVAGTTDFPVTSSAFQKTNRGAANVASNAFVAKFNPTGSALLYSTYLGGSGLPSNIRVGFLGYGDAGTGIVLDGAGNAYVAGTTFSKDFPVTRDALQSGNKAAATHGSNAFLTELNPTGGRLNYSTYLGGMPNPTVGAYIGDGAFGIGRDGAGLIYVTGQTYSQQFPVTGDAYQKTLGSSGSNAFLSKFDFSTQGIGTSVTLSTSASVLMAGQPLTVTVKVKPLVEDGIPTGTVSVEGGGSAAVTVPLDDTGSGTYTVNQAVAGTYAFVGTYSGDSTYAPSSGSVPEHIYGAPASLDGFSGSGGSAQYGKTFVNESNDTPSPLVVLVKDARGDAVPGAVVQFSGAGLKFPQPSVKANANGVAMANPIATAVGTLTAVAKSGSATPATFTLTGYHADLTVTAQNVSVPYGQPIPKLTYTITGFVLGDTSAVVSGAPTETTTATQGSPAGTYPITIGLGTLTATNYQFFPFVNGTLTITPQ